MSSVFWSAESEALRSAEHYGPLKTRLYHRALWSAGSEAKNHGKISNFRTFLLYLDYELLLRSLRSLRSKNYIWKYWQESSDVFFVLVEKVAS